VKSCLQLRQYKYFGRTCPLQVLMRQHEPPKHQTTRCHITEKSSQSQQHQTSLRIQKSRFSSFPLWQVPSVRSFWVRHRSLLNSYQRIRRICCFFMLLFWNSRFRDIDTIHQIVWHHIIKRLNLQSTVLRAGTQLRFPTYLGRILRSFKKYAGETPSILISSTFRTTGLHTAF
jgi:hypothetical protein